MKKPNLLNNLENISRNIESANKASGVGSILKKEIELVDPIELKPLPDNDKFTPNHSEIDYELLSKSIKEQGINTALHITSDGLVVCGNTRLKIVLDILENGTPEERERVKLVPVYKIDRDKKLTESDIYIYAMRDNIERRQLNDAQKLNIVLSLEEKLGEYSIASLKKKKMQSNLLNQETARIDSPNENINEIYAKQSGLSVDKVVKLRTIKTRDPNLFKELEEGKTKTNTAYKKVRNESEEKSEETLGNVNIENGDDGIVVELKLLFTPKVAKSILSKLLQFSKGINYQKSEITKIEEKLKEL